ILFEHRILIFRFLYLSDCPISFEQWLIRLRQLHWHWHFPLLDQREILREIFQECQYLENSVSFSSQ
ncbi:transcription factor, partial [Listeria monocytogenes]|nr:transcription factor [Listeria monocytogenes]